MQPPFPSPVPTWHNDTYDAISPERAELKCFGKTVIITGAGAGIGRETAIAFATAGAKRLILIGRTESTLIQTRTSVQDKHGDIACLIFKADVTDEDAMEKIATEIGTWDILILNAGHQANSTSITSANLSDYWACYEANVKSVIIASAAFLPTANQTHATILGVTAGALILPPAQTPGLSAYLISKMAMVKTLEFLAVENPNVFVASMHPGVVDTDLFRKSGPKAESLPMDSSQSLFVYTNFCILRRLSDSELLLIKSISDQMTDLLPMPVTLPAHFMLWLSSPEAAFLNGKLVWANWDVGDLKAVGSKLQGSSQLTIGVGVDGWPVLNSL
ncbi:MAG: hypothetical protein Q9176_002471 [Flavoplaca citrina]